MKTKILITSLFFALFFLSLPSPSLAAPIEYTETTNEGIKEELLNPEDIKQNEYSKATILHIDDEGSNTIAEDYIEDYQIFTAKILSGKEKGKEIQIKISGIQTIDKIQYHSVGEKIVVVKTYSIDGTTKYDYADNYRMSALITIFIIFILLVLFLGRLKGFGALLGLFFSILVLSLFIVPQIAQGKNPLTITIIGSLIIVSVSLYLAHGFNKRTNLSMLSTIITLGISILIAQFFVHMSSLFGMGSEEAFFLQTAQFGEINLQGLLLAGIIIGTLGVLDDITTAQTAVIGELRIANPNLNKNELYKRALVVGKEHISSLVNTLVLAYAGASLPLFLLFSASQSSPLWFTINSQFISEEIVRTLIGSIALVLAVPISTYIAAHFLSKSNVDKMQKENYQGHHHH
ncbi:MAG: YibE/F family protein [Patescibacteria group bacterium]|nr:YibE/F family protein [Patescibacteria group bacterium]